MKHGQAAAGLLAVGAIYAGEQASHGFEVFIGDSSNAADFEALLLLAGLVDFPLARRNCHYPPPPGPWAGDLL
jgi:hypothetical protein